MRFVCAADCGVERDDDRGVERAGGTGLDVAVHARLLCAPADTVTALAPVGDDDGAELVRRALGESGVEPCLESVAGPTPVQHVRHAEDGERMVGAYDEGVLAGYRVSARQAEAIAACDVLATAAFGQALTFFESVMAHRSRGLCAVDLTNARDVGDPVAFAGRWAPELDVGIFGLQPGDGELVDALEAVARRSGRLFVVTLGPAGAVALSDGPRVACPALPVAGVIETTGSGNAFTAAFLCEYVRSGSVELGLARGVEVAAATRGQLGSFDRP